MTPIKRVPLAEALRTAPVFVDGDWIESKDQDPDGDVRLIQLADIGVGSFINKSQRFLTEDTARRLGCTFLEAGDVLIARMPDPIGRACVFPGVGQPAVTAVDVCIVRVDPEVINSSYLVHFLNSDDALHQVSSKASGSTRQRISRSNLGTIQIPLPPLEEQRRIAAILDKAGQILSSSKQANALRQHLQARLFISMFGDPRSNPLGWSKLPIEAITSDYVGGAALAPEDFVDQGTPVLHKGAIKSAGRIEVDSKKKGFVTPQTAQYHQRSLAGPGKVAVTLRDLVPSGPFIGLMADLSTTAVPEFLLAQGAYAFSVDTRKILPGYLIALVNMPTFRLVLRQSAVGSTQIHIRLPVFKSIEIPVPPIEKQHEFARIISRISSISVSSQAQIRRIDELTRALRSSFL